MYIAKQGDIVYLDFDQQAGHEQKRRRPALVISNNVYNDFTKSAIVCPITNTNRGIPTHVCLDEQTKTTGVIMCEQLKAIDLKNRNVSFFESTSDDLMIEVLDIINGFFEIV